VAMTRKIQIAIVDDYPLYRDGLVQLLGSTAEMQVVGLGGSAEEAVQLASHHLPDIVLLDLDMPGGGLNAARAIAACCPNVRIVILTVSQDQDDLAQALQAGARAYVLKGISGRELKNVLRAVQAGAHYLSPALHHRVSGTANEAGSG
jgi:two-component system nitrate/nitrite response regulator NarL